MYKINTGISYTHPTKGELYHAPGDVADLADWPDLPKLEAEGTISPVDYSEGAIAVSPPIEGDGAVDDTSAPPATGRRGFRKADKEASDEI